MSTNSIINGYYGKVSTQGDFVSRGLPASFIDPWDAWLQEAIVSSQQQLGDQWLNCYLTSPIYRFALTPGVCGENGWLGIIMPSVDNVGRYYPITIVTLNEPGISPFILTQQEESWFTDIETLALSSLSDAFNMEQFYTELSKVIPGFMAKEDKTITPSVMVTKQTSHHAWQGTMKKNQSIKDALPFFVDQLLKENYVAYSFFWTQGSELVAPSSLICEGLPPIDGMVAMLDGNWKQWGWEENRFPFFSQAKNET